MSLRHSIGIGRSAYVGISGLLATSLSALACSTPPDPEPEVPVEPDPPGEPVGPVALDERTLEERILIENDRPVLIDDIDEREAGLDREEQGDDLDRDDVDREMVEGMDNEGMDNDNLDLDGMDNEGLQLMTQVPTMTGTGTATGTGTPTGTGTGTSTGTGTGAPTVTATGTATR